MMKGQSLSSVLEGVRLGENEHQNNMPRVSEGVDEQFESKCSYSKFGLRRNGSARRCRRLSNYSYPMPMLKGHLSWPALVLAWIALGASTGVSVTMEGGGIFSNAVVDENCTCDDGHVLNNSGIHTGSDKNNTGYECPIFALLPFRGDTTALAESGRMAFSHMAAVLMAIDHFNARDPAVVPQLGDPEWTGCDVHLPTRLGGDSIVSDVGDAKTAVATLVEAVVAGNRHAEVDGIAGARGACASPPPPALCAVLGPFSNPAADAAAKVSYAAGAALLSYGADLPALGRNYKRPATAKIVPDVSDRAAALLDYVAEERGRDYISVVYAQELTGLAEALQSIQRERHPELQMEDYVLVPPTMNSAQYPPLMDSMRSVLSGIKESGYRTIIVALSQAQQWNDLFEAVEAEGMSNPAAEGYFWMVHDVTGSALEVLTKPPTSEARMTLLRGMASVSVLDGFQKHREEGSGGDRFMKSWRGLAANANFVQRLNDMNPIDGGGRQGGGGNGDGGGSKHHGNGGGGDDHARSLQKESSGARPSEALSRGLQKGGGKSGRVSPPNEYVHASTDYFLEHDPAPFSGFAYDAVIALGMGKCRARMRELSCDLPPPKPPHRPSQSGPPQYPNTGIDDFLFYDELVEVGFSGATGENVTLHGDSWFTRDGRSMAYGVYNIRLVGEATTETLDIANADPEKNDASVEYELEYVLTSVRKPFEDRWTGVEGSGPFVFADGTTNEPISLLSNEADKFPIWGIVVIMCFAIFASAGVLVYAQYRKRQMSDLAWTVKKSELKFDNPPQVIGTGTFGLVRLAEYRGTQVAVKHVLPQVHRRSGKQQSIREAGIVSTRMSPRPKCVSMEKGLRTSGTEVYRTSRTRTITMSDIESGVKVEILDQSEMGKTSGQSVVLETAPERDSAGKSSAGAGLAASSIFNLRRSGSTEYSKLRREFIEEMRQLSKLRHPCITTVMGAVIAKEPLLVMEYMQHGSLHDLLHNETLLFEGDLLLPILRDISQGIRFLHAASPQVIHADLKAKNILVDSGFRAKVADFGLSQKKQVGAAGTPYWMAPELLRKESSNNALTDVYAFGMILYEVYSRSDPYSGEDYLEVIRQVADKTINKRPGIPPSCPSQVLSLMNDCLEGEPEKRPNFEEIDTRLRRLNVDTVEPTGRRLSSWQIGKEEQLTKRRASWKLGKDERLTKTETLLYEVFPPHIAEALRDGRKVEPDVSACSTIFFSDIVGFTDISSQLTPIKVSDMLDRLYNKFDMLSKKHDVFKVETIGDAYMAVTNLVKDQSEDHAKRIAMFSLDALQAANDTLIDVDDEARGVVNIRVGFHSGPVVANVVGSRNPRYCLFGDTVNVASRMESNSLKNRIHCSERAASVLREQDPEIKIQSRGLIEVKGKGQMHTYWVNQID